jgi:hypothetical protein
VVETVGRNSGYVKRPVGLGSFIQEGNSPLPAPKGTKPMFWGADDNPEDFEEECKLQL